MDSIAKKQKQQRKLIRGHGKRTVKLTLPEAIDDLYARLNPPMQEDWNARDLSTAIAVAVICHSSQGKLSGLQLEGNTTSVIDLNAISIVRELAAACTRYQWVCITLGWLFDESALRLQPDESFAQLKIVQILKDQTNYGAAFGNSLRLKKRHAQTNSGAASQAYACSLLDIATKYTQAVNQLAQQGTIGFELNELRHRQSSSSSSRQSQPTSLPRYDEPLVREAARQAEREDIRTTNLLALAEKVRIARLKLAALQEAETNWCAALLAWEEELACEQHQQEQEDLVEEEEELDNPIELDENLD